MSVCLSIDPSIYLSIYRSIHPSVDFQWFPIIPVDIIISCINQSAVLSGMPQVGFSNPGFLARLPIQDQGGKNDHQLIANISTINYKHSYVAIVIGCSWIYSNKNHARNEKTNMFMLGYGSSTNIQIIWVMSPRGLGVYAACPETRTHLQVFRPKTDPGFVWKEDTPSIEPVHHDFPHFE